MHIVESDPLNEVRRLRARYQQGEIDILTYHEEFRRINTAASGTRQCANDGRLAVVIVGGVALCEVCYLKAKRPC